MRLVQAVHQDEAADAEAWAVIADAHDSALKIDGLTEDVRARILRCRAHCYRLANRPRTLAAVEERTPC